MRRLRLIFVWISVAMIGLALRFVDYHDLLSKSNMAAFLAIISMLFSILSLVLSNRYEARNNKKSKR